MKFYDREVELEALNRACSSKDSEMIVISGRRRIGKSRLVDEFLKDKEHAKVFAVPKEERQVANDFADSLRDEYAPTFNNVREALAYFFTKSRKRILFIDEFPNLMEVNPALPYEFQRAWEEHRNNVKKILILSGSYVGMMDRIFTRQKAPLFGRASHTILLQPLPIRVIWEMQDDIGVSTPLDKVRNYCIFGGVPYYYELIEKRKCKNVVKELFFDVDAPLKEEGLNVLRQEFGSAYKKYFSIIEAIGAGLVSAGEIANRLGVSQTTLSKYIISLQRDFRLIERIVPYGENPSRSKKGVYSIKDNLIAFWFAHVYGKTTYPTDLELDEFVSRRFEFFCAEFLADFLRNAGERLIRTGRWWGQVRTEDGTFEQREIDIVAETNENLYLGECKWTREKMGKKDLARLVESGKGLKTRKPVKWVLFSKSGFTIRESDGAMLFDPKRIENEIDGFS